MNESTPHAETTGVSIAADKFAKVACLLMVGALILFSLPLHWRAIRTEMGDLILTAHPSVLGFYLAGASLICAIAWFILAIGFKASQPSEEESVDESS
jgi:hypothetical protein